VNDLQLARGDLLSCVGVSRQTVLRRRRSGSLRASAYAGTTRCLFDPATEWMEVSISEKAIDIQHGTDVYAIPRMKVLCP
jgi:hypothetical protein